MARERAIDRSVTEMILNDPPNQVAAKAATGPTTHGQALNRWREEMKKNDPEGYREMKRQAGIKSGQARRKHRVFRDLYKELLTYDTDDPDLVRFLQDIGLDPTHEVAMALASIKKAETGDIEANRYVRDTIGEKPTENFNMGLTGKPIEALDLSQLTDEELEALASAETAAEEE